MKKLSMSWVALAMVSLGLAQNPHANFEQSNLGNGGTLASNSHYLEEVLDELTPNPIRFLETVVSDWELLAPMSSIPTGADLSARPFNRGMASS